MTSEYGDDPCRSPHAVETESENAARTPGLLEWIVILGGVAFTGGLTFPATCVGAALSLGVLLEFVSLREYRVIGLIAGLAVFVFSVGVSGYIAWRTGRAIHRLFNDVVDEADL